MVACPVCEEAHEDEIFLSLYTSPFNRVDYRLYHCPNCDIQWWEPLKIVPEFYEGEGDEAYSAFHSGAKRNLGENHTMFVRSNLKKQGVLLDVGCGDCLFLQKIKSMFKVEAYGIDLDRYSIAICKEKRDIKNAFVATPLEFVEYCREKRLNFDIVTLFEVLEHQDKPLEFLRAVGSMLKPGGYIAGTVPNRESWIVHMDGAVKGSWDLPPHHLLRFSLKSLRFVLERAGFRVLRLSLSSFGVSKWLKFALYKSKGLLPAWAKPQGKYLYFEARWP